MNTLPFDIIAFDIDGTIFSSEEIILDTYVLSIRKFSAENRRNVRIPERNEILNEVGKPVRKIFENLLPELSLEERDSISDNVLLLLCEKINSGEGHYYPDVFKTVSALSKKYRIAAASNGRLAYVSSILNYSKIMPFFLPIVVIDQKEILEKGDIVKKYSSEYGVPAERILMVGDRFSDWEAARKSGAKFAYCSYGHANPGEIPDFEIELKSFSDLLDFL